MESAGILLLYVLMFVGALLVFDGLIQLFFGSDKEEAERAVNKRLRLLSSGMDPEEVLQLLRRQRPRSAIDRVPVLRHWPPLVIQAGLTLDPMRGIYGMAVATLAMVLVLQMLQAPWLFALALGAAIGVGVPVLVLMTMRGRRLAHMQRQMPEGIDMMVRSLRSGHPLNSSIQAIARELGDPLGSEMGVVADAITYGEDLTDAVTDFAERSGLEDARYLAMAISIQGRTGGNLAAVLESLSRVIRERFGMQRKIRALSSEGRITAYVVSAAPVVIYLALNLFSPSFYGDVRDDPIFPDLLGTGIGLAVINALWLRKLVRFHF